MKITIKPTEQHVLIRGHCSPCRWTRKRAVDQTGYVGALLAQRDACGRPIALCGRGWWGVDHPTWRSATVCWDEWIRWSDIQRCKRYGRGLSLRPVRRSGQGCCVLATYRRVGWKRAWWCCLTCWNCFALPHWNCQMDTSPSRWYSAYETFTG